MKRGNKIVSAVVVALIAAAIILVLIFRKRSEPVLAKTGAVTAFQIDEDPVDPGYVILHNHWAAVKQISLGRTEADQVHAVLNNGDNFRMGHAKCFSPGMGFRVGEGKNVIDALVCLHCDNIYFYRVTDELAYKSYKLTPAGHDAFLKIYRGTFGEPATMPNASSLPTTSPHAH